MGLLSKNRSFQGGMRIPIPQEFSKGLDVRPQHTSNSGDRPGTCLLLGISLLRQHLAHFGLRLGQREKVCLGADFFPSLVFPCSLLDLTFGFIDKTN